MKAKSEHLSVREAMREREKARRFWKGLDTPSRWDLGDELVEGRFEWEWWLPSKPSRAFMDELDHQRILWEQESS